MDALECMLTRRSVRKFKNEKVSEEKIRTLLECAMNAPSAVRAEDWEFIVVDDRKMLDRIGDVNPYAKYAKDADLAILVCGNLKNEKQAGLWQFNCAAATENILLAAHALGLGAVWTVAHPIGLIETAYKDWFGLPEGVIPIALVIIGVPDMKILKENRYKEQKVHRNKW